MVRDKKTEVELDQSVGVGFLYGFFVVEKLQIPPIQFNFFYSFRGKLLFLRILHPHDILDILTKIK